MLVVVRHEFLLLHTKLLKYTNYSGHEDTCAHAPELPGDVLFNQASIQHPLDVFTLPWVQKGLGSALHSVTCTGSSAPTEGTSCLKMLK